MELVSMLAALIFLTLYAIGAIIYAYYDEIRTMQRHLIQKLLDLVPVRNPSVNDKNR